MGRRPASESPIRARLEAALAAAGHTYNSRPADWSRAMLYQVAAGTKLPRVDRAIALARALGTTVEKIWG